MLDKETNYIVSGLERSGTSLVMQMLQAAGVPVAYDHSSRPPDENNPRGYFELEGGKIISRLMENSFPLETFSGRFIKITAYGLKYLPRGKYKIIYAQRNIEEVLDSMEKMTRIKDADRDETRRAFVSLNAMITEMIRGRDDVEALFVNYNDILDAPEKIVLAVQKFLDVEEFDRQKMIEVVDKNLYRNRRGN